MARPPPGGLPGRLTGRVSGPGPFCPYLPRPDLLLASTSGSGPARLAQHRRRRSLPGAHPAVLQDSLFPPVLLGVTGDHGRLGASGERGLDLLKAPLESV